MLKIENVKVEGFEAAVRGMRNPMNSWDKSDSFYTHVVDTETGMQVDDQFFVGENDLDLMKRLAASGSDHAKFRRMIVVTMDITAPLYWWKEFDTYKVGTVANSCSTMHKIHDKKFTLEDFSCEHLASNGVIDENRKSNNWDAYGCLLHTIDVLNYFRESYLKNHDKRYWWQMIQLLPSSYNQRRTVMVNYEVLHNIYHARNNHKLDEWHVLCDQIEDLPYSEVITGREDTEIVPEIYMHDSNLTFVFDSCDDGTNFMSNVCELWHKDHLISFNRMLDKTTLIVGKCPDMRPSEWNNIGWGHMPFCEGFYDSNHAHYIVRIECPDKVLTKESV